MKAFRLANPKSLEAALALLAEAQDPKTARATRVLAGGQDLLTEMKEHLVEPERLVNLKGIAGLDHVDTAGDTIRIGALATIARLADDAGLATRAPGLVEAARSIASPQIRSTGTVGGNLNQRPRCWYYRLEGASCLKKGGTECLSYSGLNKYNAILGGGPSYIVHPSDLAPALVAFEAQVTLRSAAGERTLALEKFFTLPSEGDVLRETVLRPDEVLTEVRFAAPRAGSRSTYVKFKERGSYDFALVSVALAAELEGGLIRKARLCLGGVAPVPWRVADADQALVGQRPGDAAAAAAAASILRGAEPLGQNAYKIPLTQALIARAVRALA